MWLLNTLIKEFLSNILLPHSEHESFECQYHLHARHNRYNALISLSCKIVTIICYHPVVINKLLYTHCQNNTPSKLYTKMRLRPIKLQFGMYTVRVQNKHIYAITCIFIILFIVCPIYMYILCWFVEWLVPFFCCKMCEDSDDK